MGALRKAPDGHGVSQGRLLGGAWKTGEPAGDDDEGERLSTQRSWHMPKYGALTANFHGGRGVWHSVW